MLSWRGPFVWHVLQFLLVGGQVARTAQDPVAFAPDGDGKPAR